MGAIAVIPHSPEGTDSRDGDHEPTAIAAANARLIAAAPELLAALEALLADCGVVMSDGYVENNIHGDEVAVARAAIAKARGEVA